MTCVVCWLVRSKNTKQEGDSICLPFALVRIKKASLSFAQGEKETKRIILA
jgi:hypothetical protein